MQMVFLKLKLLNHQDSIYHKNLINNKIRYYRMGNNTIAGREFLVL
jgi:hypothetical protein